MIIVLRIPSSHPATATRTMDRAGKTAWSSTSAIKGGDRVGVIPSVYAWSSGNQFNWTPKT